MTLDPLSNFTPVESPLPQVPGSPTLETSGGSADRPKVGAKYIWLLVLAQFGVFVAFITPLAISLTIRVAELAPGHEEYLGYITGVGALAALIVSPFLGVASDRTRSRIGRRRPFIIAGLIVGLFSLLVMASAPNALILGLGWVIAQIGWGQALNNLQFSTADKLPEEQRGKVAGLAGFATQVAPVLGVSVAGLFAGNALLLFFIPGVIGAVLILLFVLFIKEADTRGAVFDEKLTIRKLLGKFVFNPRRYPDFSLVWAGRFLFYFGLTLNTTFTSFFFAYKLGVPVTDVAGIIASIALLGILATTAGAIGGGFLSDKLKRRRIFVLASGLLFAAGAITMALSGDIVGLTAGSLLTSLGIGMFSAVDQALLLDVLPERDTDAGRFMSITNFATSIPQAAAPLIAPIFLAIGVASADEKNYLLLYIVAAVFVLAAGTVVLRIRSVR